MPRSYQISNDLIPLDHVLARVERDLVKAKSEGADTVDALLSLRDQLRGRLARGETFEVAF
jgi:hypothetical protein